MREIRYWPEAGLAGMESFGASAPAGAPHRHFGIAARAVASRALAKM